MQLTLLGTGAALPSADRVQSGVLVADGSDRLLVDCGSGVVHRMAQAGIDHRTIDTVLLTHHHLDHVADLPTLAKARYLDDRTDLHIGGPPGTDRLVRRLLASDDLIERLDVTVEEFGPTTGLDFAGFTLDAVATPHTEASQAYRLDDRTVLSGDTPPCEAVFELADGVHTLIHECAYPDSESTEDHTTPTGLVEGLNGIALERLVVTHLFPSAEREIEAMLATLASGVDASVHVGTDRMQLGGL